MFSKYFAALFISLLFFTYTADAQYDELGLMLGGSRYKGELSRHMFSTDFVHPAFGLFYRHNRDRHFSWKIEFNYGRISGDDDRAKTPFELDRNLSFFSDVWEFSPLIEYNFHPFETGRSDYPFTTYIFTGLTFFHFNPKAKLGSDIYELQPLGTEGQGVNGKSYYKRFQVALPIGGGIKIAVGGNIGIGIEVGARRTYTDYLDDVSTMYPDMNALMASNGPIAVQLSDRSFSRLDTSSAIPNFYRKQRGNASDNDWYLFGGITIFFRLESTLRDICKPFKLRRY